MIEDHFGLRRRPFPATPDHAAYYPATTHERGLARLHAGLVDDEGMVLLTGEPGTGKTLLCHNLLDRLPKEMDVVFLTHTHVRDRAGLLQVLLYDLSLPYENRSEQDMRLALIDHLLTRFAGGHRTILVIDEAHHLSAELLEELRLLGNLEGKNGKAIQVVFVAQADLLKTLDRPELAALRQRLAIRVTLDRMPIEEAADYMLHHLRVAGGKPDEIIDGEALEILARQCLGIPRLLNQAGHQALRLAEENQLQIVDVETALTALEMLGLASPIQSDEISITTEMMEEVPMPEEGCRLFLAPGRSA